MSNTTTANPQTLAQQATTPILRHFQMDADVVGTVQSSLNLFAGKIGLPIELISLKGRGGLNTAISIAYSSDVAYAVDTWNVEAPTGALGLGWSLEGDTIERDVSGSLSPYDDAFYLRRSDGSATQLHLLSRGDALWEFEAEDYDFSRITYDPATDGWIIQTIDGLARSFGGNDNARQRGVHWGGTQGNWTDASIQGGQRHYTLAWNLSEIRNPYGDAVTYRYSEFEDDEIRIGSAGGLAYTRAKYLMSIVDPSGRELRFHYGSKRNDDEAQEYVPPHVEAGDLHAYQDRYETRFLDRIELFHPERAEASLQIRFTYVLGAYSGMPGAPAKMVKRYLTGFALVNEAGKILPGMRFAYETRSEADYATGALIQAVFPNGAVADYAHERRPVGGAALSHVARRDETGAGVPRVWIGPNYSLILRYDPLNGRRLVVTVYDWNGRWLPWRAIDCALEDDLDLATLTASLQEDFFVLAFRQTGRSGLEKAWCQAVRRRFGCYGVWDAVALDLPAFPRPGVAFQVAAADHFILGAVEDCAEVVRYAWDPRAGQWSRSVLRTGGGGLYELTASGANALVARRDPVTAWVELTLLGFEPGPGVFRTLTLDPFAPTAHPDAPPPSYCLAATYAGVVFMTHVDEDNHRFDYESRQYRWDRLLRNPVMERQFHSGLPTETEAAFLSCAAVGSLFGNAQNLARFNGSDWVRARLGDFSGADDPLFAFGRDIALVASGGDAVAMAYRPEINAFERVLELRYAQGPAQPTVAQDYVTIGNRIYHREPDGGLRYLRDLPADAERIANDGDRFIAYAYPDGRSYVLLLRNGETAAQAEPLVGRAFATDDDEPGRFLSGPTAFATYVGPDFDAAEEIRLHRCLHGRVSGDIPDYVVVECRLRTRPDLVQITRVDYPASGTTGPFGLSAQYAEVVVSRGDVTDADAFGSERHVFFDGLTPPEAGDGRPYGLFNGLLRRKDTQDAQGRLLMVDAYDWAASRDSTDARTGAARRLFGAFVRPARTRTTYHDPLQPEVRLEQWLETRFNPANGLVSYEGRNNIDSRGDVQRLERQIDYAFSCYPDLLTLNWLEGVALDSQSVDDVIVSRDATLWSSDWGGAIEAPAVSIRLRARTGEAALSSGQWQGTSPPGPDWQVVNVITRRDRFGAPVAEQDVTRLESSLQTDGEGRFQIASWVGADLARGQAGYIGFEPYEDLTGWILSSGDMRAAVGDDDTHCGRGALRIPPGASLRYSAPVTDPLARHYAVSAWVKVADTGASPARVRFTIGEVEAEQALAGTEGQWSHVVVLLEKPADAGPQNLLVEIHGGSEAAVVLDDLWFGPAASQLRTTVWDTLFRPIESFTNSGQTQRKLYGDYDEPSLEVDALEALVVARSPLRAWPASGEIDMRWNSLLTLKPQTLGLLQRFRLGTDWAMGWTGEVDRFSPTDGRLEHRGTTPATIDYGLMGETGGGWFITARVRPSPGGLAGAYGLHAGGFRLTCDDDLAGWALVDAVDGVRKAWASFAPVLDLPSAVVPGLDAGRLDPFVVERLAAAATPLGDEAVVEVIQTGHRWRIQLAPGRPAGYELVLRDGQVAMLRRDTELTLLVAEQSVLAFADGRRLFCWEATTAPPVEAGLHAAGEVSFDNLGLGTHSEMALDYQDGALLTHQSQVAADDHIVAVQRVYDARGRAAISSQGATLPLKDAHAFAYCPDIAVFDWSTKRLVGRVADQNPDSGDFAYARSRYEDSPSGRPVERGLPGGAFAIPADGSGMHTIRTRYGLSDGRFEEAVGAYRLEETFSPDGQQVVRLTDLRDQLVLEAARASPTRWDQSWRHYDRAGRLSELQSPMGWSDTFAYDFLGQRVRVRHANDEADRLSLYDTAGRLRFAREPDGDVVAAPYFRWTRYDLYSRPVAEGVMAGAWDPVILTAHAEDPDWPSSPTSVETSYDGLWRGDLLAVGFPARAQRRRQDESLTAADPVLVEEERFYDIWAQTVAHAHLLTGSGADQAWQVGYEYDNQGKPVALHYPALQNAPGLSVDQTYDRVGRLRSLAFDGQKQAYRYNLNGLLEEEAWTRPDGSSDLRRLRYNSAAWPVSIVDAGLEQTLTYVDGGLDERGWFSGRPASIRVEARGGVPAWILRLGYDEKGALEAFAIDSEDRAVFRYDRNGNLTRLGGTTLGYDAAGRDRTRTTENGEAATRFSYRQDGAVRDRSSSRPEDGLALGYDLFDGAALHATRGEGAAQARQEMRYDAAGLRVLRRLNGADTLYVRSLAGDSLLEVDAAGGRRWFVHGPSGPAFIQDQAEWAYLSRDSIGSIRGLVDTASRLVTGYDFLPFGGELRTFGSQRMTSPYRFVAREWDPVALYDLRARFYDPSIGRFLSQDPKHQQASPYAYASNLPLLLEDPDGEELFALIFGLIVAAAIIETAAVGALIGAGVGAAAGVIGAVVEITSRDLEGGEAAGVFFGFVGLGVASGAIGGAITGGVGAALEVASFSAAVNVGISTAVATTAGGALGAAESAGQAALLGEDPGEAAWTGSISSAIGAGVGNFLTETLEPAARLARHGRAAFAPATEVKPNGWAVFAAAGAGGAVGGATSGAVAGGLNGNSSADVLLGALQSTGLGLLGAMPELRKKPWKSS